MQHFLGGPSESENGLISPGRAGKLPSALSGSSMPLEKLRGTKDGKDRRPKASVCLPAHHCDATYYHHPRTGRPTPIDPIRLETNVRTAER
jgi:hypothetical protein